MFVHSCRYIHIYIHTYKCFTSLDVQRIFLFTIPEISFACLYLCVTFDTHRSHTHTRIRRKIEWKESQEDARRRFEPARYVHIRSLNAFIFYKKKIFFFSLILSCIAFLFLPFLFFQWRLSNHQFIHVPCILYIKNLCEMGATGVPAWSHRERRG